MNDWLRTRPQPPPLDEVLEFMRLVWGLNQGLERTSRTMEAQLGITGQQRMVVRLLGRFPGMTARQLADTLKLHPSTVSGLLKRLEKRGLVDRRLDERDRRRAFLGLTKAGRALDTDTPGTVEDAVRQALSELAPKQIAGARETLEVLERTLGRIASTQEVDEGGGGKRRTRSRPTARKRR